MILILILVVLGSMVLTGIIGFGWLLWNYKDKEYEETKLF